MECCNWNCDGHAWSKHMRCSKCRRADINTCVDCDSICNRGAYYCRSCRDNHTAAKLRSYFLNQNSIYPNCVMCEVQLESRKLKTCRGDCLKLYRQLDFIVRRGNTKVNDYYILERQ